VKKLMFVVIATLLVMLLIAVPGYMGTGSLSGYKICLDPGHGGSDPGAVNEAYDLKEKEINLDVAYRLKALLEVDNAVVVMAREDNDTYMSNSDRYTFCNNEEATILVSVHTNSVDDPSWDGSLGLYAPMDDPALAQAIYDKMYPFLRDKAPDGVDFRDFGLDRFASGVLFKSDMPAAMMEPLFMSNPAEASLLDTPIYLDYGGTPNPDCVDCRRAQIAQAIHGGIVGYFAGLEPTPTPEPGGDVHVEAVEMELATVQRGPNLWTYALAKATILDQDGFPVEEATVYGNWSGATSDSDSGVTGADGKVSLESDRVKDPSSGTTFTFTVDDVTLSGWTYDSLANVETTDSITIP